MSTVKIAGSTNLLRTTTVTVGTTTVQVLLRNKERAGYRVIADSDNTDNIYHGSDSNVTTANSPDVIAPGGRLEDVGLWNTIYRGEVWLISGTAAQTVTVEEIIAV